jgi:anti-sigma factor RsiW
MAGGENDEMTCQELVELVTDYLEAVLPEPQRERLEAHLAECPYCEEYIAQMRQTIKRPRRAHARDDQPRAAAAAPRGLPRLARRVKHRAA